MKLPIPHIGKKEKPEYLLALLLRQEKATAVIIEQLKKDSKIVGKNEEYFQTNLEDASEEEWLKILDQTISKAEETLPSDIETHKTIFGVPASWVEEKHIKKDYLLKLKKTSESLSLTPIGFLEIPEAVSHLLQEEEGAPVSAILAEIGKEYLAVSLIRGGRVIETKSAKLQETPAKDVDLLLRSFANVEVFPSRIIIFNGGYDEKLAQSFISHHWSKSLPFLHMPQISILPEGFDAKAVVFGAATQIGFDILGALSLSGSDIKTFHTTDTPEEKNAGQDVVEKPTTAPQVINNTAAATQANFGFVKDQDIALVQTSKETNETAEAPLKNERVATEEETNADKNDDIEKPAFTIHSPYSEESNIAAPQGSQEFQSRHVTSTESEGDEKQSPFKGLLAMPMSLLSLAKMPNVPKNKLLYVLLPIGLAVLLGLLGAYTFLLQATITLAIAPKSVDQNENITFAQKGGNDFDQNIIQAKTTSISLSGSTSTPATGKKETGTKAKGTVTIFNSSDLKKQLQEGSTITSSNNLEFTLDKDVTIASATGDIFSGIKSGTAQVAVSAKQIGSEYNIPSNIKFSVGDNASLAAKNDSAFSGGSKKNVTVVSQADIAKVTAALPKSLDNKARDALSKKLSSNETLLTVIPDFKPSKKDFSEEVGDEAKTVTLSSSVTFEAVSYDNDDLLAFTKSIIQNKFDPKLTVADEDIKNTLKNVKESDENLSATLTIQARLLPKIEKEKLQKELAGKSFETATEILHQYPQVEDVSVSLFPPIPLLPKLLPRQAGNITITVNTNE